MGHDSIDKHIKIKLDKRAIQPSSEAWGKLSNMLNEENQQSDKKGYYKYFVAASIVFLLGFFFTSQYNTPEGIIIDDAIVEAGSDNVKPSVRKNIVTPADNHLKNDAPIKNYIEEKGFAVANKSGNNVYVESFNVTDDTRHKGEIKAIKEKVNQYLVQLEKSKQEKLNNEAQEYSLDAEINALLTEASNKLSDEKLNDNSPSFQLDEETDLLLAAAFQELNFNPEEDAVNETLKNKLFKELEKGYFKSKMLLTERSQLTRP